jgi:hypothetical protein
MKKHEIMGLKWLRTQEVTIGDTTISIRELPASAKQEVFAELRRMREAGQDEAAVNDYFITELVFRSVIDEDGEIVFDIDEERQAAFDPKMGLPGRFFSEVFEAVNQLNELVVQTTDEQGKVSKETKKKSSASTEVSTGSCGSEASPGNSDLAA